MRYKHSLLLSNYHISRALLQILSLRSGQKLKNSWRKHSVQTLLKTNRNKTHKYFSVAIFVKNRKENNKNNVFSRGTFSCMFRCRRTFSMKSGFSWNTSRAGSITCNTVNTMKLCGVDFTTLVGFFSKGVKFNTIFKLATS